MMRLFVWSAPLAAACGIALFVSSAGAQSPSPNCGGERWSQAEMRYVTTPCAAQTAKTAGGKDACGSERWSQADMRYVATPCTAQAPKSADGKETCGGERWSQAEMRYVGVPCAHQ
jgi:hypothetical protein